MESVSTVSNISKDTQNILEIVKQALNERESLIRHMHKEIVSYKLSLDGAAPTEYLQSLDTLTAEQLIETYIQLKQAYQKRLAEEYGVNSYRKI